MEQSLNDGTPKKLVMTEERSISTPKLFPRYLLLSNNSSFSPSPCRRIVRNPFENQLHERLHLPVISDSPSLFQTVRTPKHLFEWTIDELSSLNPVTLEPHETQFHEELDPVREAQAQDAISSFFKEQKIVPSPIECQLRNQRIVLKSERSSLKIVNSTANACSKALMLMPQKREAASQTHLTLPPELPKEVEDLLKKYHFFATNDETQNCETEVLETTSQSNRSMMDISTLRRKLFIPNRPATPSDGFAPDDFTNLSPAPRTPELTRSICEVPNDETTKTIDSFGCDRDNFDWQLSPIQAFSPTNLSINDVSMLSENGHDKTPSRGQGCKKLKKKGKNLHSSFCLMQNSCEDLQAEDFLPGTIQAPKRFDSGFPADDEESKLSAEYMSDSNMQF